MYFSHQKKFAFLQTIHFIMVDPAGIDSTFMILKDLINISPVDVKYYSILFKNFFQCLFEKSPVIIGKKSPQL